MDERWSDALQKEIESDRRKEIAEVGAVHEMVAMIKGVPAEELPVRVHADQSQVVLPDDLESKLRETHRKAEEKWGSLSLAKDWDQVCSDLSSFRFSGEELSADPRRSEEYREKVVAGLGFSEPDRDKKLDEQSRILGLPRSAASQSGRILGTGNSTDYHPARAARHDTDWAARP